MAAGDDDNVGVGGVDVGVGARGVDVGDGVGDCSGGESCGGTWILSAWPGCRDLPGRRTWEPGEAARRRAGVD